MALRIVFSRLHTAWNTDPLASAQTRNHTGILLNIYSHTTELRRNA